MTVDPERSADASDDDMDVDALVGQGQELVDAIVAHVERGIELINLLCASRTVFSSQVFRSLRDVFVHLSTDDAYRLLIDLLEDHPAALSQIRLLEISLESYTQNISEWHSLPALLDAVASRDKGPQQLMAPVGAIAELDTLAGLGPERNIQVRPPISRQIMDDPRSTI